MNTKAKEWAHDLAVGALYGLVLAAILGGVAVKWSGISPAFPVYRALFVLLTASYVTFFRYLRQRKTDPSAKRGWFERRAV